MSIAKRQTEEEAQYFKAVKEILFEIGAIATCEYHPNREEFYYCTGNLDDKQIYAYATNRFKVVYPELTDNKLFRDQVKRVLAEAGLKEDCPVCMEIRNG